MWLKQICAPSWMKWTAIKLQKKCTQVHSDIFFPVICKQIYIIPKGLQVTNSLCSTYHTAYSEGLCLPLPFWSVFYTPNRNRSAPDFQNWKTESQTTQIQQTFTKIQPRSLSESPSCLKDDEESKTLPKFMGSNNKPTIHGNVSNLPNILPLSLLVWLAQVSLLTEVVIILAQKEFWEVY